MASPSFRTSIFHVYRVSSQTSSLDLVPLARGLLFNLGLACSRRGPLGGTPKRIGRWRSMALGSYVAGSTPMGGGTVGFPILVLLFEMPARLGRDFSFAVQSVGMVSAAIFILARRQVLAWSMLKGAMLGAVIGTPLASFTSHRSFPGSGSRSLSPSSGPAFAFSISLGSTKFRPMRE